MKRDRFAVALAGISHRLRDSEARAADAVCEHGCVRRSTLLVLIAVGAAVVGFAIASAAERIRDDGGSTASAVAATPQVKVLDWREAQGTPGERLVFGVRRFQVLADGWRARVWVKNDSKVAFDIDKARRSFGLMLFDSGNHDEFEQRNRSGTLPALRSAVTFEPAPPPVLEPRATWTGTISAPGPLASGSWARFVFGTFEANGVAPDSLAGPLTWITDRAYPLHG
jgi:hypothetical protein